MLEALLIFTRGGLILWSSCGGGALGAAAAPIDALIRSCLLEDRSADATFSHGAHALRWAFCNSLGLVFVAVYRRVLQLLYVDDLLAAVRREFGGFYHPKGTDYADFDDVFRQLQLEAEKSKQEQQPPVVAPRPSTQNHSHNNNADHGEPNIGGTTATGGKKKKKKKNKGDSKGAADSEKTNPADNRKETNPADSTKKTNPADNSNWAFDISKIQSLIIGRKKTTNNPANTNTGTTKTTKPDNGRKKFNRIWDDKPSDQKLDFTDPDDQRKDEVTDVVMVNQGQSMMDKDENEDKQQQQRLQDGTKNNGGWLSSMFQSIAGNNVLEKSDLQPALKALKDTLMTKNVAEEIAEKLCESVAASLKGKKLGSFTRVSSTVQTAMEEALLRILTPRRSIDILRDVQSAKEQGRPYVVVFVGVNGVGKSTNLAKVAYWLLQHNLSVTLAACDTFRSGAVEQLRTHARRLQIPIFEKGYEKDPAVVAKEAIQDATRNKLDVVLVDTAGRMQNNEPLMRALSKLINLNNPDLVLFVGEALVGNDAVDQLTKFNQKLEDLSSVPTARLIDGILLTKFDTIDDKVGAALSMVYISGAPVMFVGCGQSYTDLKKLNVKSIVRTLLK